MVGSDLSGKALAKPEALGVRRLGPKSVQASEALKARNSKAQGAGCAAAGTLG
jgi:hypothetical protein